MLNFMVDGQTHDIKSYDGVALDNIIGMLSSEAAKNGRFIASLKVNGEELETGFETGADMVLADISSLEVTTVSSEQLVLEALAEGGSYLVELRNFLIQTTDAYRTGNETKGRELFIELIQGLEWFVKIASTAELQLKVDFAGTICSGQTLSEAVDSLNQILLEIIVAQEQRDWVLLTDLLEYELAPQLELWREIFSLLCKKGADNFAERLQS